MNAGTVLNAKKPMTAMLLYRSIAALAVFLPALVAADCAMAQPGNDEVRIVWEVKNRFRLFRSEADFRQITDETINSLWYVKALREKWPLAKDHDSE